MGKKTVGSNEVLINVFSSELHTGGNATLEKEDAILYAKEKVSEAIMLFDNIFPVTAHITLKTDGDMRDPVQKVDIALNMKGHVINQHAHSRSVKKAIDRAIPELKRQIKRYKTKKIDKGRKNARNLRRNERNKGFEQLIDDSVLE